jgi:hypothetical protein
MSADLAALAIADVPWISAPLSISRISDGHHTYPSSNELEEKLLAHHFSEERTLEYGGFLFVLQSSCFDRDASAGTFSIPMAHRVDETLVHPYVIENKRPSTAEHRFFRASRERSQLLLSGSKRLKDLMPTTRGMWIHY